MLKLIWTPGAVGLPDSDDFKSAQDELRLIDNSSNVRQSVSRNTGGLELDASMKKAIDVWLSANGARRVVLMVHGYDYDPSDKARGSKDDPFRLVYASPKDGVNYHHSWLPIVGEIDNQGNPTTGQETAIAFGWSSSGSFWKYADAGWNNSYQYAVFDLAPLAARSLACVLSHLCQNVRVTVDILAHSLGTRTVCQAIGMLKRQSEDSMIRRAVLMAGAEYCVDAFKHLAGRRFDIFNIASREDKVLALGGTEMGHPVRENGSDAARVIGRNGLISNRSWLDIQLDRLDVVAWFKEMGYAVSAFHENDVHPSASMKHWSCYMNDGNRLMLHDLLAKPEMTIGWFREKKFPEGITAPHYGHFNPEIPPTPTDLIGRRKGKRNDADWPDPQG